MSGSGIGHNSGVSLPTGVPPGGNTNDVLTKVTGSDYDDQWAPPTGGGGSPGAQGASGVPFSFALDDVDVEAAPIVPGQAGAPGAPGASGTLSMLLQAEDTDTEPAPIVPGTAGAPGTPGAPGGSGAPGVDGVSPAPIVLQPEDSDDTLMIPGRDGAAGVTGGTSAPVVVQPEDMDDVMVIPGQTGAAGAAGVSGPAIVLQPEDPEEPVVVPGTTGAAGAAGGGGTITQKTVVLPFPAKRSHSVTGIVDAAMTATDKMIVSLAGVPETQENASDSIELLGIRGVPGVGVFELQATFLTPVAGAIVINYMRAA